jgi:hypothetical protein
MRKHAIKTGLEVEWNLPRGRGWRLNVYQDGELLPAIAATAWLDQAEWTTDAAGRKRIATVTIWSTSQEAFDAYRSQPDTLAVIAVSKVPNDNQQRTTKEFRRIAMVSVNDDLRPVVNAKGRTEYCATAAFVEFI